MLKSCAIFVISWFAVTLCFRTIDELLDLAFRQGDCLFVLSLIFLSLL
jgi:hypothetical protein